MKPLTLEFCGINSFSEPASIDFSKLLEYGIFGIFGDTGSGKSTILDCIGFALYGNVARSRSGSIGDVINFALEKAYVHFSFEITFEGKRRVFRVERELKRKNAAQSVKVYEKEDEKFVVVSDGVRESNALLERIVGLEQRDFEKCIALPQGEFAQFVRSTRADRLKLVSRLFDLEEYGDRLVKRANARYAAAFARDKSSISGWGKVKIRHSLAAKGIVREDIAAALDGIGGNPGMEKLVKALETKAVALNGDPYRKFKLLRFALGRGYEYDEVRDLVDNILRQYD